MKRLLRGVMLLLVRVIGALIALISAASPTIVKGARKRILLIRPDHLGDLVLTTPVLDALRQHAPNAHITMLVGPWSSEVVARHPAIDRLITCPFPGFQRAPQHPLAPYKLLFSTAQQLRRQHYDLAINLRPDFWWGAALIYLAAIPRRVGYGIQPGTPFLTHAPGLLPRQHSTVSSLRLTSIGLQTLDLPALEEPLTPERYPLRFEPTGEERAWVQQRLEEAGIAEGATLIVIHPGTGGAVKLWRNEAWSKLTNMLVETASVPAPVKIVLTGSPSERGMLDEIARGMNQSPLMLTQMTVGQLAALLARARLVAGVDNGPLHLAAAQGTPTIVLFGPTDPRVYGPWGSVERQIVIASTQRCSSCPAIPCNRLDFTPEVLPYHPCVRLIPEMQVYNAMLHLLSR